MRGDVFAHIARQPDSSFVGAWTVFMLRSAFQPIFAFQDGKLKIAAYEGLLRPTRNDEPVQPGEFFSKIPADQRMHVETLSRTVHLLNAGTFLDPSTLIFINFDPSVFIDRALTDKVLRDLRLVLHEAGIDHNRIVCEMTEHPARSETTFLEFVAELRDRGFRIAVDDYGADDSDIGRIEKMRPDIVKFDAGWTIHLMGTRPGIALLSTMVSRFQDHGIQIVFEGVEESWQIEVTEEIGANMIQGFALARPQVVPGDFLQAWRHAQERASNAGSRAAGTPHLPVHHRAPARAFGHRRS